MSPRSLMAIDGYLSLDLIDHEHFMVTRFQYFWLQINYKLIAVCVPQNGICSLQKLIDFEFALNLKWFVYLKIMTYIRFNQ